MRSIGRLLGIALVGAALSGAACASGGSAGTSAEVEGEAPEFVTRSSLFRHHAPRARLRDECVVSLGRGATRSGGDRPPVIEIDGQRFWDGCPPPAYEPEDIVRVELIDSSEAGMLLGSRGAGGLIRMYTR